jgi:hypothetical protein
MPVALVNQKDVDDLVQSGKLSVTGPHRWNRGDNKNWAKIAIPVQIHDERLRTVNLRIVISVSHSNPEKRDFVLLWNNIPVRRLCIAGNHSNRHTDLQRWIRQTHKHTWTDHCLDRFAYTPTDITAEDINGQFDQFCAECGIDNSATLEPVPPIPGGLFDAM